MIEDDLRNLLASEFDVDVIARILPSEMTEGIVVQEIGGRSSKAGIRRNYHLVSVMGISMTKETASQRMKAARDYLITHIPMTVGGTHYYTARAQADGKLDYVTLNGPRYVEFVDMEVGASL